MLSEKDRKGMGENFTQPARTQMPKVARPDGLGLKTANQLAKNGFNPAADLDQAQRPGALLGLARLVWGQQTQVLFGQDCCRRGRPIIPVTQYPTVGSF